MEPLFSCCIPWTQCQTCGEDYPIHMVEEVDGEMICEKCKKEKDD